MCAHIEFAGGAGKNDAQLLVADMKARGFGKAQIRDNLKPVHGYKAARIAQLVRPALGAATQRQQQSSAKRAKAAAKVAAKPPSDAEDDPVNDCGACLTAQCLVPGGCVCHRGYCAFQTGLVRTGKRSADKPPRVFWLTEALCSDDEAEYAPDEKVQHAEASSGPDGGDVEFDKRSYREFFDDVKPLRQWAHGLRRRRWGDGIAVRAIANVLERPVVI